MTRDFRYKDFSSSMERELALLLGRITHHIHPDIVKYISEQNVNFERVFQSISPWNCTSQNFLYPNSDCVFPGFRRPINSEKIGKWKNNVNTLDGTILNDNTFPRHIWAFLSVNKAYSGGSAGMWSSSGLANFELAHVFAHKRAERTLEKEVFKTVDTKTEPYGLFTSASNVVLIPKGFSKPTDQMKSIKVCFYKRHFDLYGDNVIGLGGLDERHFPDWLDDIQWLEPELPKDWKVKIDNLLDYRSRYLTNKYSSIRT
ncbi:hypothetical protein [Vibrio sp. HN007]|uniref:hypothetical protein n=1 Tax=Vibrio iocasae TaxID=3098914 RepID=UPI0035D3FDF6